MGSISRHITPLVITSLGGRHTDTHIHTLRRQDESIETKRALATGWCALGLIKHSLAHLQDLISTLAGVITYIYYIPAKVGIKIL